MVWWPSVYKLCKCCFVATVMSYINRPIPPLQSPQQKKKSTYARRSPYDQSTTTLSLNNFHNICIWKFNNYHLLRLCVVGVDGICKCIECLCSRVYYFWVRKIINKEVTTRFRKYHRREHGTIIWTAQITALLSRKLICQRGIYSNVFLFIENCSYH